MCDADEATIEIQDDTEILGFSLEKFCGIYTMRGDIYYVNATANGDHLTCIVCEKDEALICIYYERIDQDDRRVLRICSSCHNILEKILPDSNNWPLPQCYSHNPELLTHDVNFFGNEYNLKFLH